MIGHIYTALLAPPVVRLVSVADSGAGDELLVVYARSLVNDSAVGADAPFVHARLAVADLGAGLESLGVLARMMLAEAGAGADGPAPAQVFFALSDNGAGFEAVSGQDVPQVTPVFIADVGQGAEQITISVMLPIGDSGIGQDAPTRSTFVAVSDVAYAIERLLVRERRPIVRIEFAARARSVAFAHSARDVSFALSRRAVAFKFGVQTRAVDWAFSFRAVEFTFTKDTQ